MYLTNKISFDIEGLNLILKFKNKEEYTLTPEVKPKESILNNTINKALDNFEFNIININIILNDNNYDNDNKLNNTNSIINNYYFGGT